MQTKPPPIALRALGALGLLAVLVGTFLLVAGAASAPSAYVPGAHGGFPHWLSGPFRGLGVGIDKDRYQALLIAMTVGYGLVLLAVRALPGKAVWLTIIAAHLLLLLGPVLFSQDLFGYLSYARLGTLHGLDPYTHTSAAAPQDAVYPFLGWHGVSSPYGPLFTLGSYALVPLGLATGVWALKLIASAAGLAAVALVARAAGIASRGTEADAGNRAGAPSSNSAATAAAAFVGLNPVLLAFAVGGAHNDTIIVALLGGALLLSAGAEARLRPQPRGAVWLLAISAGVKLSAGLALPFLVLSPPRWRARGRLLLAALGGLLAVAVIGVLGFGSHALGFLGAVRGQQQLVAVHSVPAELARLVGLSGVPGWWRDGFAALFVVTLATALWRTARGADWRTMAGWTTLALLLCTAWLLPWYAIWALPFAAVGDDRRLRAATLAFCAYALLTRLPLADPLLSP